MPAGRGAGCSGLREAVRPGISRLLSARHPQLLGRTGRGAQPGRSAAGWRSPSGSLRARGGAAAGAAPPAGRGEAGGTRRTARRPPCPPCPAALVPWARAGARPSPGPRRWASSGAGTPRASSVYHEWRSPGAVRKVASTAWERASWVTCRERVSPRKAAGGPGAGGLGGAWGRYAFCEPPPDRWGLPR